MNDGLRPQTTGGDRTSALGLVVSKPNWWAFQTGLAVNVCTTYINCAHLGVEYQQPIALLHVLLFSEKDANTFFTWIYSKVCREIGSSPHFD